MSVVKLKDSSFKIKLLSKEYQHTCKSTGLMLWESARLMASVLDRNPNIVSGKRVLELDSGCTGICSMVAARSAKLVVATDACTESLTLLTENIRTNLESSLSEKLKTGVLEWGNKEHIEGIKGSRRLSNMDWSYWSSLEKMRRIGAKRDISPNEHLLPAVRAPAQSEAPEST